MMLTLILAASLAVAPVNSPELSLGEALDSAVRNSPAVGVAGAQISENQALLDAAHQTAAPLAAASYAQAPQGGNNGTTIEQRLFTLGAAVNVNDFSLRAEGVARASADLQSAQIGLLEAQREERLKAIGLFYDVLRAQTEFGLRDQDVDAAKNDLRNAQRRFAAGDAPRLDIVRAQVAVSQAQTAQLTALAALQNARAALGTETGFSDDRVARLAQPKPPAVEQTTPALVAAALARRPDLLQARSDERSVAAAVRIARRSQLPALTASLGYSDGVDAGIAVRGPSANVTLGLPLSRASADQVSAARFRLRESALRVAALERQISTDVAAAARARVSAGQELQAVETGYRSGASSSLDVLDARRTYVQAALNEAQTTYDYAQAIFTLREIAAL